MDSKDKFAQMLREGYEALDPEKEQREYIRELLRQKELQRKRRIKTITAVAAAFLIVVGAVLAVGGCFGAVEADKNDRTKVEENENGVIISDENADGQEVMPETAMTTDWNKVDKLKEKYPEMITFTDVPDGMAFVSVEVVKQDADSLRVTYLFVQKAEEIYMCQRYHADSAQETKGVEKTDEGIQYKGYNINIDEEGDVITANTSNAKEDIDIIGKLQKKDIFKILDKIKAS